MRRVNNKIRKLKEKAAKLITKEKFEKAGTDEARQKLTRLNEILAQFDILNPPKDTAALVNKGKKVLAELSRELN